MTAPRAALPRLPWGYATLQKSHSSALENEDAVGASPNAGRFAVADGASEGWQSGAWSRHLVGAYAKRAPSPPDFPKWLKAVRDAWKPPAAAGAVSWYAETKSEQGSFATLLGLQFVLPKDGKGLSWKAVAVGDSCLVVVHGDEVATAWPVETPAGFGNAPSLIPSSGDVECPEPDWLAGRGKPGDLFLLGTDAVAAGLLKKADAGLWQAVRKAVARDTATDRTAALLELAKDFQRLQNDDVTLLAVTIPASPESPT